jgi:hypothetical protein
MTEQARDNGTEGFGMRWQLLILTTALFLMLAFQTVQLLREHQILGGVRAEQEATMQEGRKLRLQLDALAGKTAQLAKDGDANAQAVVDRMRSQGIVLKGPATN